VRHWARAVGCNVASKGFLAISAMQAAGRCRLGARKDGFRPRAEGPKETCHPPPQPSENNVTAQSGMVVHAPRS
jgi:hypothetical protein